jgi:ethylbenzene dioxygenase subunit beta
MLPLEQHLALTQQLYVEARALDEERFEDWLALLADDVRYRMPLPARRFRSERALLAEHERGAILDEDKARLALRVRRLRSGVVWAEDPRNCVRRIVSNVEIYRAQTQGEARVYTAIEIHRSRMDAQRRRLTAGREDVWRLAGEGWLLCRREVHLDDAVVLDSNLNVFF